MTDECINFDDKRFNIPTFFEVDEWLSILFRWAKHRNRLEEEVHTLFRESTISYICILSTWIDLFIDFPAQDVTLNEGLMGERLRDYYDDNVSKFKKDKVSYVNEINNYMKSTYYIPLLSLIISTSKHFNEKEWNEYSISYIMNS